MSLLSTYPAPLIFDREQISCGKEIFWPRHIAMEMSAQAIAGHPGLDIQRWFEGRIRQRTGELEAANRALSEEIGVYTP